MTRLSGQEPRHWHNHRGGHRMADPRQAWRETNRMYWTPDDRAYADHLEEHERLAETPEPQPDDGPSVLALFEHIESLEQTIRKERQLIIALRQKAVRAPEEEG